VLLGVPLPTVPSITVPVPQEVLVFHPSVVVAKVLATLTTVIAADVFTVL
jgi:hypothetical protein